MDDGAGKTLVGASSVDSALKDKLKRGADKAAAAEVGKLVAERAVAAGIKEVVFDRGGYLFHGRVKALADAAREGGLACYGPAFSGKIASWPELPAKGGPATIVGSETPASRN